MMLVAEPKVPVIRDAGGPRVRIRLAPAESLQTLGPSRKLMRIEVERGLRHLDKGVGRRVRISFAPAGSQQRTRRGGLRALGLLLGRTGGARRPRGQAGERGPVGEVLVPPRLDAYARGPKLG